MADVATLAVLQLHHGLGFLASALAFGVLVWCMVAFRWRRGYITPALAWVTNLLGYNLAVIACPVDSAQVVFSAWGQVITWQAVLTIAFMGLWLVAEGHWLERRRGHTG